MVQHPVAMAFDPDGRLWVVEMRGYMPDPEGHGEDKPVGRVSILEDTDGDGRMDKATVFVDNLVMPRTISLLRDGDPDSRPPPKLLFCAATPSTTAYVLIHKPSSPPTTATASNPSTKPTA